MKGKFKIMGCNKVRDGPTDIQIKLADLVNAIVTGTICNLCKHHRHARVTSKNGMYASAVF